MVKTKWSSTTIDWYVSKGYQYTKTRDDLIVRVEDLKLGSRIKVLVKCDYCGKIFEQPYERYLKSIQKINKSACSDCAGKKLHDVLSLENEKYYNLFVEACKQNGYIPISKLSDYKGANGDLYVECLKHGIQNTTYVRAMEGRFCPECGHESGAEKNRHSPEKVKEMVESKNHNKLINAHEYINSYTNNLRVICGLCGDEWTTSLSSILASDGACPACGIKKVSKSLTLSPERVTEIIESRNNNKLLNPHEYIKNDVRNLKIQCGQCGRVYTASLQNYIHNNVDRCPACTKSESSGEKLIREFLECHEITYQSEKIFDDCKDKKHLPFDFYLPSFNKIIEFDGPQHFKPIFGEKALKSTQKHDKMKNDYCEEKGINLIRISYLEGHNIEQILTEQLNI